MSVVALISALTWALLANGSPVTNGQVRHTPDPCTPTSCGIEPAHDLSPAETRVAMSAFAACMIKRYPKQVHAWLEMPVFDRKTKAWMKALPGSHCVAQANVGMIAMDPLLLRGAFFGAFYAQEFGAGAADVLTDSKPDYPVATPANGAATGDDLAQVYVQLVTVGECIVRADPAAARELILSKPNSAIEHTDFQKIAALVPRCTQQSLRLSTQVVRTMVAEPLYRLSALHSASAPATEKQAS